MTFTKIEGLGNDFIVTDLFNNNLILSNKQILEIGRLLCNRHFFVGGDGFILISTSDKADLKMIIVNSDGTEANMCGNGLRCAGLYAYKRGLVMKKDISFETKSGIRKVRIIDDLVEGDMGKPVIGPNIDLDSERIIEAKWEENLDNRYSAKVKVYVDDVSDILLKIITLATKSDIIVDSINLINRNKELFYDISVKVRNISSLTNFLEEVKTISNVNEVEWILI